MSLIYLQGRYRYIPVFNGVNIAAFVFAPGYESAGKFVIKIPIFIRYRFTDAFNQKALPMDLPPITIGMQFFH